MAWPETIRVKISSEAAACISVTQVVARDMAVGELVELILPVTGKDTNRMREILLRGTLVSGASRFRWAGWEADAESLAALLDTFPGPEPARPFRPETCLRAVLRGAYCRIEMPREAAARASWLKRRSFWEVLMAEVSAAGPRYGEYSYKEKSDCFRLELSREAVDRLREGAGLLGHPALRRQVRSAAFDSIELFVERRG